MREIAYSHNTNYRVYYRDSDAAGVMYYGKYAEVFEIGRTELFRSVGVNARALQASNNVVFPVATYTVKYKIPAFLDDPLQLKTTLVTLGRSTVNCKYELFHSESMVLLATASTVNVSVDLSSMKMVRMPSVLVEAMQTVAQK